MTRTRIVATLGPATATDTAIAELVDAGVDVVRLNFSHGTREEHAARINAVRRVAGHRPVAILADLAGPKFRLDRPVRGAPGDVVEVPLPAGVRAGDTVLLCDGRMRLKALGGNRCEVVTGGDIPAGKGINFPASRLEMPSLTAKDRGDLAFAVGLVDYVGVSFVRRPEDLAEAHAAGAAVVAKIETAPAVENADAILAAADAVMVARGDLGVEIPIERVPAVQKRLIAAANRAGKPVITATQMLVSMVENPMPTRAEATDVANAVLDGTDAVMLSEETAIGRHAPEAVRVMGRILREAEAMRATVTADPGTEEPDVIAHAACEVARRVGAKAIVVPTKSGASAQRISRWRPGVPIIALAASEEVRRRLSLTWGVTAVTTPWYGAGETVLERFREPVRATGLVAAGEAVVVTAGWPFGRAGLTNLVHVATL